MKLENKKGAAGKVTPVEPEMTGMDMDEGVDEVEDTLELDDDGNFISDNLDEATADQVDDEEDEEVEEGDEPDDDEEQEESEPAEPDEDDEPDPEPVKPAPKHKNSPAEIKLIEQRKEIKRLKEQLKEKQDKKQAEDLVASYVEKGYDEETAKRYASEDVRSSKLEHEIKLLRFEKANARVFDRFPDAAENSEEIMRKAEAADMTAEEICYALYGNKMPAHEAKALKAARGESVRTATGQTVRKTEGTESKNVARFTQRELRFKQELERRFNGGKPLTAEEFSKYRGKVGT